MEAKSRNLRWIAGTALTAAMILVLALALRGQTGRPAGPGDTTAASTATGSQASGTSQATTPSTSPTATPTTTAGTTRVTETTGDLLEARLKTLEALISDPFDDPLTLLDEKAQSEKIDWSNRYFRPSWQPSLTLYAANAPGRPAERPVSGKPTAAVPPDGPPRLQYLNAPFAALIPDNEDQTHWFALTLPADVAAQATKILWQVSLLPFDGADGTGGPVSGLLLSGEMDKAAREFSIDFAKVSQAENRLRPGAGGGARQAAAAVRTAAGADHHLRTYYVRAFPLGNKGRSIGDTGSGLPVLYGQPVIQTASPVPAAPFALLAARSQGEPGTTGESPNSLGEYAVRSLVATAGRTYYMRPEGYAQQTTGLVLQVSRIAFAAAGGSWSSPPGLVYEERIPFSDERFAKLATSGYALPVDFSRFAPPDGDMAAGEALPYHIRILALGPGASPGTASLLQVSRTVRVDYSLMPAERIKQAREVTVNAHLPQISQIIYRPADFEVPGWEARYAVIRQPSLLEVFGVATPDSGAVDFFPAGARLRFSPLPQGSDPGLDELRRKITPFYAEMAAFYERIRFSAREGQAALNTKWAASLAAEGSVLPLIQLQALQEAARYVLDYDLPALGLPADWPQQGQLARLGADYLAACAWNKAALSADSAAAGLAAALGDSLRRLTDETALGASPNPLDWAFVRLDTRCLYTPSCVMFKLHNPHQVATPEGWLSGTVDQNLAQLAGLTEPEREALQIKYGGGRLQLFQPVAGLKVPALQPGQTLIMPVFLKESVGMPASPTGAAVSDVDFQTLYWGPDAFEFHFTITYRLPDPNEAAKSMDDYAPDTLYSYLSSSSSIRAMGYPSLSWLR